MQIGMTLPSMVRAYDRDTTLTWCRRIDEGPFSSLACGERLTFFNQEITVLLSAAAALTERVRIVPTVFVAPLRSAACLAKQVATLDVLSGGRVTLGVGIGGREHDYRAAGAPFARRHARLDAQVAEMRRLWAGEPPFEGADPVGPAPVQPGGPPLWAGAMGPKAVRRAAAWADGICGFAIPVDVPAIAEGFRRAEDAWAEAGRDERPRRVTGFWYAIGPGAVDRLGAYAYEYLRIFGEKPARALAASLAVHSEDALRKAVDEIEAAGCDELILVPTSSDPGELDRTIELLEKR